MCVGTTRRRKRRGEGRRANGVADSEPTFSVFRIHFQLRDSSSFRPPGASSRAFRAPMAFILLHYICWSRSESGYLSDRESILFPAQFCTAALFHSPPTTFTWNA